VPLFQLTLQFFHELLFVLGFRDIPTKFVPAVLSITWQLLKLLKIFERPVITIPFEIDIDVLPRIVQLSIDELNGEIH
jgi:hypothetical protein